jgi:2-methylisocitrate lyase-like PEP mutase family enzyme
MNKAETIRRALKRDTILMPGVYDELSARIANQAGFEIIFISGYSLSATALGEPDFFVGVCKISLLSLKSSVKQRRFR